MMCGSSTSCSRSSTGETVTTAATLDDDTRTVATETTDMTSSEPRKTDPNDTSYDLTSLVSQEEAFSLGLGSVDQEYLVAVREYMGKEVPIKCKKSHKVSRRLGIGEPSGLSYRKTHREWRRREAGEAHRNK